MHLARGARARAFKDEAKQFIDGVKEVSLSATREEIASVVQEARSWQPEERWAVLWAMSEKLRREEGAGNLDESTRLLLQRAALADLKQGAGGRGAEEVFGAVSRANEVAKLLEEELAELVKSDTTQRRQGILAMLGGMRRLRLHLGSDEGTFGAAHLIRVAQPLRWRLTRNKGEVREGLCRFLARVLTKLDGSRPMQGVSEEASSNWAASLAEVDGELGPWLQKKERKHGLYGLQLLTLVRCLSAGPSEVERLLDDFSSRSMRERFLRQASVESVQHAMRASRGASMRSLWPKLQQTAQSAAYFLRRGSTALPAPQLRETGSGLALAAAWHDPNFAVYIATSLAAEPGPSAEAASAGLAALLCVAHWAADSESARELDSAAAVEEAHVHACDMSSLFERLRAGEDPLRASLSQQALAKAASSLSQVANALGVANLGEKPGGYAAISGTSGSGYWGHHQQAAMAGDATRERAAVTLPWLLRIAPAMLPEEWHHGRKLGYSLAALAMPEEPGARGEAGEAFRRCIRCFPGRRQHLFVAACEHALRLPDPWLEQAGAFLADLGAEWRWCLEREGNGRSRKEQVPLATFEGAAIALLANAERQTRERALEVANEARALGEAVGRVEGREDVAVATILETTSCWNNVGRSSRVWLETIGAALRKVGEVAPRAAEEARRHALRRLAEIFESQNLPPSGTEASDSTGTAWALLSCIVVCAWPPWQQEQAAEVQRRVLGSLLAVMRSGVEQQAELAAIVISEWPPATVTLALEALAACAIDEMLPANNGSAAQLSQPPISQSAPADASSLPAAAPASLPAHSSSNAMSHDNQSEPSEQASTRKPSQEGMRPRHQSNKSWSYSTSVGLVSSSPPEGSSSSSPREHHHVDSEATKTLPRQQSMGSPFTFSPDDQNRTYDEPRPRDNTATPSSPAFSHHNMTKQQTTGTTTTTTTANSPAKAAVGVGALSPFPPAPRAGKASMRRKEELRPLAALAVEKLIPKVGLGPDPGAAWRPLARLAEDFAHEETIPVCKRAAVAVAEGAIPQLTAEAPSAAAAAKTQRTRQKLTSPVAGNKIGQAALAGLPGWEEREQLAIGWASRAISESRPGLAVGSLVRAVAADTSAARACLRQGHLAKEEAAGDAFFAAFAEWFIRADPESTVALRPEEVIATALHRVNGACDEDARAVIKAAAYRHWSENTLTTPTAEGLAAAFPRRAEKMALELVTMQLGGGNDGARRYGLAAALPFLQRASQPPGDGLLKGLFFATVELGKELGAEERELWRTTAGEPAGVARLVDFLVQELATAASNDKAVLATHMAAAQRALFHAASSSPTRAAEALAHHASSRLAEADFPDPTSRPSSADLALSLARPCASLLPPEHLPPLLHSAALSSSDPGTLSSSACLSVLITAAAASQSAREEPGITKACGESDAAPRPEALVAGAASSGNIPPSILTRWADECLSYALHAPSSAACLRSLSLLPLLRPEPSPGAASSLLRIVSSCLAYASNDGALECAAKALGALSALLARPPSAGRHAPLLPKAFWGATAALRVSSEDRVNTSHAALLVLREACRHLLGAGEAEARALALARPEALADPQRQPVGLDVMPLLASRKGEPMAASLLAYAACLPGPCSRLLVRSPLLPALVLLPSLKSRLTRSWGEPSALATSLSAACEGHGANVSLNARDCSWERRAAQVASELFEREDDVALDEGLHCLALIAASNNACDGASRAALQCLTGALEACPTAKASEEALLEETASRAVIECICGEHHALATRCLTAMHNAGRPSQSRLRNNESSASAAEIAEAVAAVAEEERASFGSPGEEDDRLEQRVPYWLVPSW